jgi:hypothetical protein
MGLFMNLGADLGVENHLRESFSVPQVNEDHPAVIPPSLYPPHQHHFSADIIGTEFTAGMGSSHISKLV